MEDILVYVIILNYNGYADTINCINSVKKSSCHKMKILIIDNGSQDESEKKIRETFPELEVIQTGKNLGFAGGNNIGIRRAMGEGADYICILNNDVVVSEDMLSILLNSLQQDARRVVGPVTMMWNTETIHSTGMKINFYTGTADIINLWKEYCDIDKQDLYCDYLEGTCLMFSKEFVEEVGMIPEVYFLYYEETEWCCKAKRKGFDVVCIPSAQLWHKGSVAANKITGLKQYFEDRNRVLFERRNAPLLKKIIFYLYFIIQLIYRILSKQKDIRVFRAVLDGFTNTIDWSPYDVI